MDFLELMNFCGYDLEKANEMANQTDTKSLLLKVSAKRAIRKQADKQVTKVIIWLWRTLTVLNGFILHTASIALTGRTAPICA